MKNYCQRWILKDKQDLVTFKSVVMSRLLHMMFTLDGPELSL